MIFFLLFTLQLIAFACVGVLAFGMLEPYSNLWDAFILHFSSSMGGFNFAIYDDLGESKKYIGIAFHGVVLLCNLLLMLNLVIAIMSDTYSRFSKVQLGLYNVGIIEAIPSYKNDTCYGGLIVMTPPISMLAYTLWPMYHFIKDERRLKSFNRKVCTVIYFPFACLFTLFFWATCILMSPIAWVKVILLKCFLGKRLNQTQYYKEAVVYFFIGLPVLILTAFVDCYWFFVHLFQWKMTRVNESLNYPKISLTAFNKFYKTVNSYQGETCNAKQLVLQLRDYYKTTECIFGALYSNKRQDEILIKQISRRFTKNF